MEGHAGDRNQASLTYSHPFPGKPHSRHIQSGVFLCLVNVRLWLEAELTACLEHFRSAPESRHLRRDFRYGVATSIGRRNTCVKSFCRRFKLQRLSWSLVELTSYFVQLRLRVYRQVRSLGEVLSQQPISVFIGSTLPRTLRIAEVDINVGRQGKLFVGREFLAPVPGQRFVQFRRQRLRLLDER